MLDNILNFFVHGNLYSWILAIPLLMSIFAYEKWSRKTQDKFGGVAGNTQKSKDILVDSSMALQGVLCLIGSLLVEWQVISPDSLIYQFSFLFLSIVSLIYIVFLWIDLSD